MKMKMLRYSSVAIAALLVAGAANNGAVLAAESGHGIYLLGARGPFAGVIPGPGVYFENDVYYYNGSMGKNRELPFGFEVGAGVEAKAALDLPKFSWIGDEDILGGHFSMLLSVPIGWTDVSANAGLSRPGGPLFPDGPFADPLMISPT